MITHQNNRLILWAFLATAMLLFATSCGIAQRIQQIRQEQQVPKDLEKVWEVYQTVRADFGGKETIQNRLLTEGAIQGMLDKLGEDEAVLLPQGSYDPDAPDLGGVWQAWSIISEEVDATSSDVTSEELEDAAIRGMLHGLGNPYTTYLDPKRYELEEQNLRSNFEGIGAYVDLRGGQLTIVGIIPNTPAEQMGIQQGDVILESDGTALEGLTVTEAVLLIRGPRGTPVDLLIQRPGEAEPRSVTVIRDNVEEPSVTWSEVASNPEIAYMRITEFLDNTDERLKEALEEILSTGHKGIILDVRGNPGGLLTSTVGVASQFIKEGLVLYDINAKGAKKEFPTRKGGVATDIPLIVLANGSSASGSEVLVGALQDHKRATIVGTRTFGKGSVNELRKLDDGSGIYLTAALWYTPNGRLIEGEGLKPDIEVRNEQVLVRDGLQFTIQTVDRQLETAVNLLGEQISAGRVLALP